VNPRPHGVDARPSAVRRSTRRALCVFPRYAPSFGTFDHAFALLGVKAFMPPQGLLVIAAHLPDEWSVRVIDENERAVSDADLRWADVVLITGMHVQRARIDALVQRAHACDTLTVLGGPSVSASEASYPDVDILHVGELGDATEELVDRLDRDVSRPAQQEVYRTAERTPLADFPVPAYHLIDLDAYLVASVQASSGCPFRCEFCDIPALYGRRPRLKSVEQILAELDAMLERSSPGTVYFVDDNFIGDPHAAEALLEGLVGWQRERGYPLSFACEATMNVVQRPRILELMREASFTTMFVGIESPELDSLRSIGKTQNLRNPLLETVATVNSYGIEVVAGIILGLDGDDEHAGERLVEFIEASQIPMLTINLLHALPHTPLWTRLEAEGRLVEHVGDRQSNVEYLLPYDVVVETWRSSVRAAFAPEAILRRFEHQLRHTYVHRRGRPESRPTAAQLRRGAAVLARIFWHVGVRSDYRRRFWRLAIPLLRAGRIPSVVHIASVTHHLVLFGRQVVDGTAERSFYDPRGRGVPVEVGGLDPK
jgi:radical SAM superfamily enzyme YgiQ (UPF0313 family)